jgi:hypothetical protein
MSPGVTAGRLSPASDTTGQHSRATMTLSSTRLKRHRRNATMLPASFVHATLIALDLPRSLAERYAEPEVESAPDERAEDRAPIAAPRGAPAVAPAWPFRLH